MGYQRPKIVLQWEDGTEFEGLEVRMRRLSVGQLLDLSAIRRISLRTEDVEPSREAAHLLADRLAEGIVSWNYEDDDGRPVDPVYREKITEDGEVVIVNQGTRGLDMAMLLAITLQWMDAQVGGGKSDRPLAPAQTAEMESSLPMTPMDGGPG